MGSHTGAFYREIPILDAARRCGLVLNNRTLEREEVEASCPFCGDSLEYGADKSTGDGGVITWTCSNCGAAGEEHYKKIFDKHSNVFDGEGCPFPPSAR